MTKKAKKSPAGPLHNGKVRKDLIGALLVDPKTCHWGKEMRMINFLLKQINEPDFWLFLSTRHKFLSLQNLVSQKNIIFSVRLEYMKQRSLRLPEPQVHQLQNDKVGEDVPLPPKQQTLLDFIK